MSPALSSTFLSLFCRRHGFLDRSCVLPTFFTTQRHVPSCHILRRNTRSLTVKENTWDTTYTTLTLGANPHHLLLIANTWGTTFMVVRVVSNTRRITLNVYRFFHFYWDLRVYCQMLSGNFFEKILFTKFHLLFEMVDQMVNTKWVSTKQRCTTLAVDADKFLL